MADKWKKWFRILMVIAALSVVVGIIQPDISGYIQYRIGLYRFEQEKKRVGDRLVVPEFVRVAFYDAVPGEFAGDPLAVFWLVVDDGCVDWKPVIDIETKMTDSDVTIKIPGHKLLDAYPCHRRRGGAFYGSPIPITNDWFAAKNEVRVNFVLGGKNNIYTLKKIDGELVRLQLNPVNASNVISNEFAGWRENLTTEPMMILRLIKN